MDELRVTITEDHVVYLAGYDEDGAPVLVQRLEPESLYVEDYRAVKPKRWWNL